MWSWTTDENEINEEEEEDGCTSDSIVAWFLDTLRICPLLTKVDILFWSKRILNLCLLAIKPILSRLEQITVQDETVLDEVCHTLLLSDAFRIFGNHVPHPLPYLWFSWVKYRKDLTNQNLSLPLQVRSLKICLHSSFVHAVVPFLPAPSTASCLQKLEVKLSDQVSPGSFPFASVAGRVGRTLKELWIHHELGFDFVHLSSYGRTSTGPTLPPAEFTGFSSLRHLKLYSSHGPSLEFLKSLSSHSPLLQSLNLEKSVWISSSASSSTVPDEVFPEHKVVEELIKFKHLHSVQLGILPTIDPLRYNWIKGELEKVGIESSYEVCEQ